MSGVRRRSGSPGGPRANHQRLSRLRSSVRTGAIVLAGGDSTRMGRSKALLDWHGVPLLAHLADVARESVSGGSVVIAAAESQHLPPLRPGIEVVRDANAAGGPLEGLLAGLYALGDRADRAFVVPVDVPLLRPALGVALLGLLDDTHDAVVPVIGDRRQPLLAVYRVSLAPVIRALLDEGAGRAGDLPERCRCRWVGAAELLADPALAVADPELESFRNVNTPAELEAARSRWG